MQMRTLVSGVAVASAVAGIALGAPGPAQAAGRTPWHVTVHANKTTVTLGHKVWFTGKVGKAASGRLVGLYERHSDDQPWHYQRNALVHRDGTYTTSDRPTRNNQRQYRVVMPAYRNHKKGVSPAVTVDVYAWTPLITIPSVNQDYLDPVSSVSMDGTAYPSSLEADVEHFTGAPTTQSVEFNVNRHCTMFRGTFGLSDDSVTGSQATVTAEADGAPWFDQAFSLGETQPNTFTFVGQPLKLRFESTSMVAGLDGLGAVGTPEVYCEE
jgi:hypothetical protein